MLRYMAKPLKSFSVKIRGISWKVLLLPPHQYEAEEGTDSDAIASAPNLTIKFRTDNVSLVLVRHELVHAYIDSFHLLSASVTGAQMEEIVAEWLSKHVDEYCETSNRIWLKIQGLLRKPPKRRQPKPPPVPDPV